MHRHETHMLRGVLCTCGSCHDYVDALGYCDCEDNRDPFTSLERHFPSPVIDSSDGSMWREEIEILRVLFDAGATTSDYEKSPLIETRLYDQYSGNYGVSWYWAKDDCTFPAQWDGPVIRLWARLMIRPVRCAGGYTWLVLTDDAYKSMCVLSYKETGRHYFEAVEP